MSVHNLCYVNANVQWLQTLCHTWGSDHVRYPTLHICFSTRDMLKHWTSGLVRCLRGRIASWARVSLLVSVK